MTSEAMAAFFLGMALGLNLGRWLVTLTEASRQRERCMRCEDMQKRRHSNGDDDDYFIDTV